MNQIEKNTVKAENQLAKNQFISYIDPEGKGKRVLFAHTHILIDQKERMIRNNINLRYLF